MLDYWKFKEVNALFVQGHVEEARRMLMELQARYIALHGEFHVLQKQVRDFEDILFLSQNLLTEGEHCWLRTGGIKHGPFCKPCYEYTGKLMRLESHTSVWRCPYCGLLHSREGPARMALAANSPLERQGKIIPFRFPLKQC
jgi:hypothetical protein